MTKGKGVLHDIVNLALWVTGILVSLAVGFGMIDGILGVRWVPEVITVAAGWVVVILTIVGVILAIIDNVK